MIQITFSAATSSFTVHNNCLIKKILKISDCLLQVHLCMQATDSTVRHNSTGVLNRCTYKIFAKRACTSSCKTTFAHTIPNWKCRLKAFLPISVFPFPCRTTIECRAPKSLEGALAVTLPHSTVIRWLVIWAYFQDALLTSNQYAKMKQLHFIIYGCRYISLHVSVCLLEVSLIFFQTLYFRSPTVADM